MESVGTFETTDFAPHSLVLRAKLNDRWTLLHYKWMRCNALGAENVCVCVQWLDTLCIPTNWQTISIICATANSANKFIINFPWIQSKISTFVVWFRVPYIYGSWCYVSVLRCKLIGIFSFDSDRRFGGHFNVFLCVCVCVSHSLFRFHSAFPFFPLVFM